MKYLIIILAIVLCASAVTIYSLLPDPQPPAQDVALTINGRDIAQQTVIAESRRSGYHDDDLSAFYGTIITRELLIQEAKRLQIDKEESFRKALKDYYENSLIKILMERKNAEIEVSVSDADIDKYVRYLGTVVTFTRLDEVPESTVEAKNAGGITTSALFDDLAEPVKLLLSTLEPGQYAVKFDTGSDRFAIRLDAVKTTTDTNAGPPDREHVRHLLEGFFREQKLNQWLADLSESATITIHDNTSASP